MGYYEKLLARIKENPYRTDITIEEVKNLLNRNGFVLQSIKGSHHVFTHSDLDYPLCIPAKNGRFVKPAYIMVIKKALETIERQD